MIRSEVLTERTFDNTDGHTEGKPLYDPLYITRGDRFSRPGIVSSTLLMRRFRIERMDQALTS